MKGSEEKFCCERENGWIIITPKNTRKPHFLKQHEKERRLRKVSYEFLQIFQRELTSMIAN